MKNRVSINNNYELLTIVISPYNNYTYIIAPLSSKLGKYEADRVVKKISSKTGAEQIAIDLSNVTDCTIDFIETIMDISKDKSIGMFNLSSDIFALFNYMNLDKCVKLFVSELDFRENTRHIVNRKFSIV